MLDPCAAASFSHAKERLATPLALRLPRGVIRAAALLLLLLSSAASAQDAAGARRAAEAERASAAQAAERAREAATQAERLAAERISGAARVQAAERAALSAAGRADSARSAEAAARAEQARLLREIAPLLPMLTRLAAQPAPILLAAPLPPAEVAMGLAALRAMLHEAQSMATRLREAERRAGAEAQRLLEERRAFSLAETEARLASASLDRQLEAARQNLAESSAAERAALSRAEEAVTRARSLEEALARLEREQVRRESARPRPAAAPRPPTPAYEGVAHMPVAGRLLRGFNAPGEAGPARGLTFAASPGARVTAPCGGVVVFAAPFRSYGRMVILDCGAGQHLVLAGMERLDVGGGQSIQAGEPVGVLPSSGQPTLYVELRRRGEAVDPSGFIRGGA